MAVNYRFRQPGEGDDFEEFDPEALLQLLTEDLLDEGDLDAAMDRLLQDGFTTPDGDRVEGLRDLLDRVRERRRELEQSANVGDELADYRDRLEDVLAAERAGLEELLAEAEASGDERRLEVTRDLVNEKQMALELLPDGTGERLSSLRHYDFVSSEAREAFDQMMDELRQDVLNTYFEANKEFLENPDPEALARMAAMINTLSTMIEQDRRGDELDPSFEDFMAEYGDYFPGAENLEDLVRMMAERAAAAEAMFNSLSFDQQNELRNLFGNVLNDMGLGDAMSRLIANLRQAAPDIDWQRAARFRGGEPTSFADAAKVSRALNELGQLEDYLGKVGPPQGLPEVDVDAVRRHLGDDAATHVERLQKALKGLEERGLIDKNSGRTELTAKGLRAIGGQALKDLFSQLNGKSLGAHHVASVSRGHDREETSKPWEPGEPFNLHLGATLRNAVFRQGPGTPVRLLPEDFEVEEHEAQVRSATVIAVDLSLSMKMRSNLGPAKKMVLALSTLIRTRFPRDFVAVVGFGETAHQIKIEDVPYVTVDYEYGTNLQHALALSRHLMRAERGDKQVVVVTDGEPTAHLMSNGEPFFSWPPIPETLYATMAEVLRCTKAGITINTFALDIERSQFPFVEQIARVNGGRTFYTDVDNLGAYVVDDFVKSRRG